MRFLPFALLVACIFAAPSTAASFDCAKAKTDVERLICATPKLSAADESMGKAFARAMAMLSTLGKLSLRDDQRAFLHYANNGCAIGGLLRMARTGKPEPSEATCLTDLFSDRATSLEGAAMRAGGHVFLALTTFRAKRVTPLDGDPSAPRVTEMQTLVQIDAPHTAAERDWNAMMHRWLVDAAKDDFLGEGDASYETQNRPADAQIGQSVTGASSDFISASLSSWDYTGGAHPNGSTEVRNWSLRLGRAITNADIFANVDDARLGLLVTKRYQDYNNHQHEGCDDPKVGTAKANIDADGIDFGFDPYELGGYPCGGEADMRWVELAPFLKPSPPFDRHAIQTPTP